MGKHQAGRRGIRRAAAAVIAGALSVTALVGGVGGPAGAKGGPKFENGKWNLTFSATIECVPPAGTLGLGGSGTLQVAKGKVAGTFTASGPGSCITSAPMVSSTYNGTYSWRDGTVKGDATGPETVATSHFEGTVVVETPFSSGTESLSGDNGAAEAKLVIETANAKVVTGDVQLTNGSTVSSNFFASRNCGRSGRAPELLEKHVRNGTAENPTRVKFVADASITRSPGMKAAFDAALQNWNAMLAAAGKHIVFGEAAGNGPTIYVGIDSTVFRDRVATTTGETPLEPMKSTQAGHADPLGSTAGPDFTNGVVRLANDSNTEKSWNQYVRENPQNVEGILTHEIGHILGLGHDKNDKDSIMYPDNQQGREPTAGCSDLRALDQL